MEAEGWHWPVVPCVCQRKWISYTNFWWGRFRAWTWHEDSKTSSNQGNVHLVLLWIFVLWQARCFRLEWHNTSEDSSLVQHNAVCWVSSFQHCEGPHCLLLQGQVVQVAQDLLQEKSECVTLRMKAVWLFKMSGITCLVTLTFQKSGTFRCTADRISNPAWFIQSKAWCQI